MTLLGDVAIQHDSVLSLSAVRAAAAATATARLRPAIEKAKAAHGRLGPSRLSLAYMQESCDVHVSLHVGAPTTGSLRVESNESAAVSEKEFARWSVLISLCREASFGMDYLWRPVDWLTDFGHAMWLGSARAAPTGSVLYVSGNSSETIGNAGSVTQTTELPSVASGSARIVCISDTHELHDAVDVPDGDILIVAGDVMALNRHFSRRYAQAKLQRFARWMRAQPHKTKILVGGNHDSVLERLGAMQVRKMMGSDIIYLEDEECTLDCGLCVYGTPYSVGRSKNRAFQGQAEERLASIPRRSGGSLDVLVTHGPLPAGVLGECDPRLYVHGHVHEQYGARFLATGATQQTLAVNSSICNERYEPTNRPVVVDLITCA